MSKKLKPLIRPPKLNLEDKVGVVTPAGPVDKKQLQNMADDFGLFEKQFIEK